MNKTKKQDHKKPTPEKEISKQLEESIKIHEKHPADTHYEEAVQEFNNKNPRHLAQLEQEAIDKALGAGISEQVARALVKRNIENIEVLRSLK